MYLCSVSCVLVNDVKVEFQTGCGHFWPHPEYTKVGLRQAFFYCEVLQLQTEWGIASKINHYCASLV